MSIIIRLQNLSWVADAADIRRYFAGLSIPDGGVHIVGGEMGDAFIAFSTDEDARLAMAKDGGKIQEMQIKLLLSSRNEMMRVIEKARQQNIVIQSQYLPIQQPIMPSQQPMMPLPTQQSIMPAQQSMMSTQQSMLSAQQPMMSAQQSMMSTQQSMMSAQQPLMSSQQPLMSSQQPIMSSQQPIMSSQQSLMSLQQAMLPVQQPIMSAHQPSIPVQQPARIPSSTLDSDRRRGRSPSPSHRRSRDKSPSRDRRRSPDSRRSSSSSSKRERSRSPVRRGSRDVDRRGDRFKRDDRRYDENSRYQDDRHPEREDPKKYSNNDSMNRQPRGLAGEGFHQTSNHGYYEAPPRSSGSYGYDTPQGQENSKDFSTPFYSSQSNERPSMPRSSNAAVDKQMPPGAVQSSNAYLQQPMSYTAMPYEQIAPTNKEPNTNTEQSREKSRRRSRFDANFPPSQSPSYANPVPTQQPALITGNDKRTVPQDFRPVSRDVTWPQRSGEQPEKRPGLLETPVSKNGDSLQVVPMDLEQSPPPSPGKNPFGISDQYVTDNNPPVFHNKDAPPRNEAMARKGQGTHNDNRWNNSPSITTVEIKGIPPDVRASEIVDLFRNISIPPANICIKANNDGAEKVFIRFNNSEEFKDVLSKQPYYMRNYCCQVSPCPEEAFEAAAASANSMKPRPKPKPRDEDLCVQLRGLPFSCKEKDVENFFGGLRIVDMFIEISPDGKCSGTGFIQFASPTDFRGALGMNGKMIGHRYITVSVASKEALSIARGFDRPPKGPKIPPQGSGPANNFGSPRRPKGPNDVPPGSFANGPPPPNHIRSNNFSISLRGLPEFVTNEEIANFFSDTGIGIRAFHILLNANKLPNGDGFIEVANKRDADAALSKNGQTMRGKRISVTPISFQKMSEILHGPPTTLPPPPAPGALLKTPPDMERPRRPLIPQPPKEEHFKERPHPGHSPNELPRYDHPPNDQPPFDHPRDDRPYHSRGERQRPDPRGNRLRPDFPQGERPRMDVPFRGGRPHMERPMRPPQGRIRGPFPNRPPYGGPPMPDRGAASFGPPGCVVSINNLHFRATLDDVFDFFKDFRLIKDSVNRKINENNQPTGEARVTFESPRDAQRAVRELNRKTIMGRSLFLSIL